MRIFTRCLFFQCVFTNVQCVITLLRALSVALNRGKESSHIRIYDIPGYAPHICMFNSDSHATFQ